ncbi:hypothetical protein MBLNU459_g0098t1 [Dothideomycetes sp. NU459]
MLHLRARYTQLLIAAAILTTIGWLLTTSAASTAATYLPHIGGKPSKVEKQRAQHPIDTLIRRAQRDYDKLLAQETNNVEAGVHAYEQRRGRRPPPGFDVWYKFAQDNGALIVEEFFDRIYDDLNPFWAIPPLQIRQQANDFIHRVSVRSGNTTQRTDIDQRPWMDLWEDLIGTVAQYLPDMDVAINVMDESRLIVPWETINEYMDTERKSRRIVPVDEVVSEFTTTAVKAGEEVPQFDPEFHGGAYWDLAVIGCPPTSPARINFQPETDYTRPPPLSNEYPEHSYQGYVSNWTLTKSPCDNPTLQGLHGTFVEPISVSNSKKLFPLFGGSKLPMNNGILLPPAMYWTSDPFYSGGKDHGGEWEDKENKIIWRGAASGGRNRKENWTRFQRHRFLSMLNGTSVTLAETSTEAQLNFELPQAGLYNLTAPSLGGWVSEIADAQFVHLLCFPDPNPPFCEYTDPWFTVAKPMPMKEQYSHKYLPDIDGNSFSGRYRGFLDSTSMPIKATIYDEWHDSRLVPWLHFVPMDNTFIDIYGIMEYFMGYGKKEGHDDVAKAIALGGKAWGEKVLRREDMQIYVFRLLLEYARLCDDNRERLGWVDAAGR